MLILISFSIIRVMVVIIIPFKNLLQKPNITTSAPSSNSHNDLTHRTHIQMIRNFIKQKAHVVDELSQQHDFAVHHSKVRIGS
jgi:hypothetical protein